MTDMSLFTQDNPLTNLDAQIRAHWEKYRPKMVARLKAEGKYDQAVRAATALTVDAVISYTPAEPMNGGQRFWMAWELFRNEWAFLPAEEDVPDDEGPNPALWEMPPDEEEDEEE